MNKILVVMTGGTICSFSHGYTNENRQNVRSLDQKRSTHLLTLNFYNSDSPFTDKVEFETISPVNTFSENMSIPVWNKLIACLKQIEFKNYSGVIIAHGTDTLAYTSSLMALLLKGVGVPVFIVSSNHPIDGSYPNSNGSENFNIATELICQGVLPDVYVPYKNSDGKMYIHMASRLNQCGDYSEDFFSEGAVSPQDILQKDFPKDENESQWNMLLNRIGEIKKRVLVIKPYVGIDYSGYNLEPFSAVLHGTYHSGTVITSAESYSDSIEYLLEMCVNRKIPLYLSPCRENGDIYDTLPKALAKGAIPLFGETFEMSYIKLLISFCLDMSECERVKFLGSLSNVGGNN